METSTIQEVFAKDHDRLDELFTSFRQEKRADFAKARELFKEFKFGLQRHIIWEETILFPIFERKTGLVHVGPTHVMRAEHRQIAEYLEAIHRKVQQQDPNTDLEEKMLLEVLAVHNEKEEGMLYPTLDRMTSGAGQKEAVFREMENVPEEAYRVCCGRHDPSPLSVG